MISLTFNDLSFEEAQALLDLSRNLKGSRPVADTPSSKTPTTGSEAPVKADVPDAKAMLEHIRRIVVTFTDNQEGKEKLRLIGKEFNIRRMDEITEEQAPSILTRLLELQNGSAS